MSDEQDNNPAEQDGTPIDDIEFSPLDDEGEGDTDPAVLVTKIKKLKAKLT